MDVVERMSVVVGSNVSNMNVTTSVTETRSYSLTCLVSAPSSAGSFAEGRRGGRNPSEVLHAELLG